MKTLPPRRNLIKMNLTPMIDVVFLLIIFFVVSGTMAKREESRPIPLPAAAGGEESDNQETGKLAISIDAGGILYIGSQSIPVEELKTRLLREKEASALPLEVRVRADRTLLWNQVEPILILCSEADIANLSFTILPK